MESELNEELEEGQKAAQVLVEHMENMDADKCSDRVSYLGFEIVEVRKTL